MPKKSYCTMFNYMIRLKENLIFLAAASRNKTKFLAIICFLERKVKKNSQHRFVSMERNRSESNRKHNQHNTYKTIETDFCSALNGIATVIKTFHTEWHRFYVYCKNVRQAAAAAPFTRQIVRVLHSAQFSSALRRATQ